MKNQKLIVVLLIVIVALLCGNLYFLFNNRSHEIENPISKDNSGDVLDNKNSGDTSSGDVEPSVIVKDEIKKEPEEEEKPVRAEYDVIVFGAEPEGIITAISAARNNMKVLLAEKRDGPGGLLTYAMLYCWLKWNRNRVCNY